MLFFYFVVGALSLLSFNLNSVSSKSGLPELEAEDLADLLVPAVNIPTDILDDDDTADSSSPLFVRNTNKKEFPTFAPLKSLLTWKENDTAHFGSILQIKLAIEAMHQKHESLLNHIKCVFPEPPTNCSGIQPESSKWNWTSWIPSGHKPHNFFHTDSEKHVGPIAAVFIAAIEHLDRKQNLIYEYLNCACEKKSNCTAKPGWHIFNGTYWHNKIHKLNPLNWHMFSLSKPHHKPSSGYYSGSLIHKPIIAFFNHSAESSGQTGFVVAVTGGHVPSFPTGVFGSAEEQAEGNASESGGFGGYLSASIPTYSGSVVVGNFPHASSSGQSSASAYGHAQIQINAQEQSNSTSTSTTVVNQTSSSSSNSQSNINVSGSASSSASVGGQSLTNSVPVPKINGTVPETSTNIPIPSDDTVPEVNRQPTKPPPEPQL